MSDNAMDECAYMNTMNMKKLITLGKPLECDLKNIKHSVFDYGDYITRNDVKRCDGVIFHKDSFKVNRIHNIVPLVYDYEYGKIDSVLGLAVLEIRDRGVFAKLIFNDRPTSQGVKDIFFRNLDKYGLSFCANKIYRSQTGVVKSGIIKMVHITPIEDIHTYKDNGLTASMFKNTKEDSEIDEKKA